MTYIYECDGWCDGDVHDDRPALTGEFSEEFMKSTELGGEISSLGYNATDLVTLCPDCLHRLLVREP